ncbi:hypothetical protein BASA50_003940 [Batrachochytrium salamandrivorans]|uniref:Protein kinase domain-containing protein n=1 Tax=Batrachochytrium salamandrivorans TaxID=1357716 RepID=A0ABQ8FJU1_9FUNG|nr:hypothetical protein BASA50_003940 [Batrachochytrium salamandrivorans]
MFLTGLPDLFDYAMKLGVHVNAANCAGDTALILSAKRGDLIAGNAQVDMANYHGNTSLHYASFWRHTDAAIYLAKIAGAHVNILNIYNKTPIQKTGGELQKILQDIANEQGFAVVKAQVQTKAEIEKATADKFSPNNWEISASSIQIIKPISQTQISTVYHGLWKTNHVAVKLPTFLDEISDDSVKLITKEISEIRKLNYPSLAPILAACITPPDMCYLTDYSETGNLSTFLHNPAIEMTSGQAMKIVIDVAQALVYLHDLKVPIIHGNLKSSNILLLPNGAIRLVEYGFNASLFNARNMFPNFLVDVEWLAPEVLAGDTITEPKCVDMYAFGMLLHEVVTRLHPYKNMNSMVIGMRVLVEDKRPEIPAYVPRALTQIMEQCWTRNYRSRPTAKSTASFLAAIRM